MIGRLWTGWTAPENADEYERLLQETIFPGIEAKGVNGYLGIRLLRRPIGTGEIEFTTIMWFDSWADVKAFAGEDFETAYVPQSARKVLVRFDARSRHFEVRASIDY
jgi:heme-degrading monooxygenase HmoA